MPSRVPRPRAHAQAAADAPPSAAVSPHLATFMLCRDTAPIRPLADPRFLFLLPSPFPPARLTDIIAGALHEVYLIAGALALVTLLLGLALPRGLSPLSKAAAE